MIKIVTDIYWRAVCGESRTYGSGTDYCTPIMYSY